MRPMHPQGPAFVRRRAFVRAGFSLVELIVVLAVTATLVAMVMPRWAEATARRRVDLAAARIMADVRLARSLARASSAEVTITFNVASHAYTVSGVPDMRTKDGELVVLLREDPYRVTLAAADFGGGQVAVFNAYGMLVDNGEVMVTAGDYARIVRFDGPYGEASVK
ncbi:MAG: hypothetical protein HBSAPP03_24700 [Phycisphaerae bacterium]|nr:MAG: hypothetical protein HBSAPP03_24700 [Phycisphaerae bacterium]